AGELGADDLLRVLAAAQESRREVARRDLAARGIDERRGRGAVPLPAAAVALVALHRCPRLAAAREGGGAVRRRRRERDRRGHGCRVDARQTEDVVGEEAALLFA